MKIIRDVSALRLTAYQKPNTTGHQQADLSTTTVIFLTLVRLAAQKSDILITINTPHSSQQMVARENGAEEDKLGSLISVGLLCQDEINRSFRINDWNLFA